MDSNKYQKLITNVKDSKMVNKINKMLSTGSLSDIIQINKWWDHPPAEEDCEVRWSSLEHNAVLFPNKYDQHNVKILYKGEEITLNSEQEELATFWAGLLDNELASKDTTRKNFLKEFKKSLPEEYKNATLEDFDFSPIHAHIQRVREKNKNKTTEEKKEDKMKKVKQVDSFGWALVDGCCERLANYIVEPPGIFRGRGEHPLCGKIKPRVLPEDITLNIGPDDAVPICPISGHSWGDVVQNDESTWLAYYKAGKNTKYVFLASNSKFKGMSDFKKYEKARKLKDMIDSIRQDYTNKLSDNSTENRQLAVATYLIDKLALRVGNEKGEEEADTVGCCSLRVEHIKIEADKHIVLDFLGKDSMRYYNKIQIDPKIHENISKFLKGKSQDDNLFDLISAGKLNDYLKFLMPGLSAKVFRTYNASFTLQNELNKKEFEEEGHLEEKITYYNEANKEVAILCNHQKTVAKNYNVKSDEMQKTLKEHLDYLVELTGHLKSFDGKHKKKSKPNVDEDGEGKLKKVFPDDKEKTAKLITNLTGKIKQMEKKIKEREDNKQIALGTSKLNYMDPRITVSWCKKFEVPIDKVFSKSIRDKFPWAMYVDPEYQF